jgi:hypothetical protein
MLPDQVHWVYGIPSGLRTNELFAIFSRDLGGAKMTEKSLNRSKITDQEWRSFTRNPGVSKQVIRIGSATVNHFIVLILIFKHSGRPHATREERIRSRRLTMRHNGLILLGRDKLDLQARSYFSFNI